MRYGLTKVTHLGTCLDPMKAVSNVGNCIMPLEKNVSVHSWWWKLFLDIGYYAATRSMVVNSVPECSERF